MPSSISSIPSVPPPAYSVTERRQPLGGTPNFSRAPSYVDDISVDRASIAQFGPRPKKDRKLLLKPVPKEVETKIEGPVQAVQDQPPAETARRPSRSCICIGCICINRRSLSPWVLCLILTLILLLLAAVIAVVVVVVIKKQHHLSAGSNSTVTSTVISVIPATSVVVYTSVILATSTPAVAASPSTTTATSATPTANLLGGFDAVPYTGYVGYNRASELIFYTDQHNNIRELRSSYSVNKDDSAVIATNVRAGSPIQAYQIANASEIHVFYVDKQGIVQGITASMATTFGSAPEWNPNAISSLKLETSDNTFLRVCTRDTYSYGNAVATAYLFYRSKEGALRKYGWYPATGEWKESKDLPATNITGSVECDFDNGVENMWLVEAGSGVSLWYRDHTANHTYSSNKTSSNSSSGWVEGIKHEAAIYPYSSILSVAAGVSSPGGRSHVFFQTQASYLTRLDVDGRGIYANISHVDLLHTATLGTRVSTWAATGSCGETITMYHQRENTSEVYYFTFRDYIGSYSSSVTSTQPTALPLVETWGTKAPQTTAPTKHKNIWSTVIGAAVAATLLIIGICGCCACCS